jgi:hypothetical protein
MPTTARKHFDEDIARAVALHALATRSATSDPAVATDVARGAVAFGVGALDAYLCDAFSDTLARCLKQCRRGKNKLPTGYRNLALPLGPLMADYASRDNWALRMAARALMERDNLLQVGRLKELFNPALPTGQKLWADLAPAYVKVDRKGLTGFRKAEYGALTGKARSDAPKQVAAAVLKRMATIIQRRHDVVHNCDRPKTAVKPLKLTTARAILRDVHDFVTVLDDHLQLHRIY